MAARPDFVPPSTAYRHPILVEPSDIDELGHANNVVWIRYVNEAAIAHSRSVGFDHATYLTLRIIWVVRRHDVEYLSPALEGQRLEAFTWIHNIRGATSLRRTAIIRDRHTLLRAETTWALIDTASGKPRRIPKEMMARYGLPTGDS